MLRLLNPLSRLNLIRYTITCVTAWVLCMNLAIAEQANPSSAKRASAVMAAISLLFDEDTRLIELTPEKTDVGVYPIRGEFEVTFPAQTADLEFCFTLLDYKPASKLTLSFNSESFTGLVEGQNCYVIDRTKQATTNRAIFSDGGAAGSVRIRAISVTVKSATLRFDRQDSRVLTIRDQFTFSFARRAEAQDFCFVVSNVSPRNGLILTLNGVRKTVKVGENCFAIPGSLRAGDNQVELSFGGRRGFAQLRLVDVASSSPNQLGLESLTRARWDERAVRKVLNVFAFGGHARDAQIIEWANMRPDDAIREILNFSEHNLKLSPLAIGERYTDVVNHPGTLAGFTDFLSSESSDLPIPLCSFNNNGKETCPRKSYGPRGTNFDEGFARMITVRGLNPFRQYIGFWETNTHLAINLESGVSRHQTIRHYDDIMEAHESGVPYHEVIGVAAKSAAMAVQYGHLRNEWIYSRKEKQFICKCNEDGAREIHQLFFGIFGENDPDHEDVTIKETAKMLTDMKVKSIQDFGLDVEVTFGTEKHHSDSLYILGQNISGRNASEKIDNLMPISMAHPETRLNLPIKIISDLADDNLSESAKRRLREAWDALGDNKDFITFIRSYATSTLFHSPRQAKYFTSHHRALFLANKNNLDNLEAYIGGTTVNRGRAGLRVDTVITGDDAGEFFRPLHNVFGAQTSLEASDSALAFEENYNDYTDFEERIRDRVQCESCDQGAFWQKKWHTVLPKRSDGQYYVADVAAWLWKHVIGHHDDYTDLEKAHLYSLLAATRNSPGKRYDNDHTFDFNLLMCLAEDYRAQVPNADLSIANLMSEKVWNDYCIRDGGSFSAREKAALNRVYTTRSIRNNSMIQQLLQDMGQQTLPLNTKSGTNGGADRREHARERISSALGFIFTTPFVFAEGQQ